MPLQNNKVTIAFIAVCFLMLLSIGQSKVRLPFIFVNCTGGIIEEDLKYAEENGRLAQTVETTGTMKLYQENVTQTSWLLYEGEFNIDVHNISLGNLSEVRQLVFDFKYKVENNTFCMRLA